MMHRALGGGCFGFVGRAALIGEDGDQAAIAGIEVEMAFVGVIEVGLIEDERHAEHALPEINRGLPVGTDEGDVMHALGLQFAHVVAHRCSPI